jgi:hypothetical protein
MGHKTEQSSIFPALKRVVCMSLNSHHMVSNSGPLDPTVFYQQQGLSMDFHHFLRRQPSSHKLILPSRTV